MVRLAREEYASTEARPIIGMLTYIASAARNSWMGRTTLIPANLKVPAAAAIPTSASAAQTDDCHVPTSSPRAENPRLCSAEEAERRRKYRREKPTIIEQRVCVCSPPRTFSPQQQHRVEREEGQHAIAHDCGPLWFLVGNLRRLRFRHDSDASCGRVRWDTEMKSTRMSNRCSVALLRKVTFMMLFRHRSIHPTRSEFV